MTDELMTVYKLRWHLSEKFRISMRALENELFDFDLTFPIWRMASQRNFIRYALKYDGGLKCRRRSVADINGNQMIL